MPITPKPTAARQQRRRHRGRRCVSGRSGAWVGPRAKRKACFPLAAPTLGRGRSVIQTLFQSGKPGYRRVGASAYATQRARVPQRFGGGQMFQPPLEVFLRERSAVGCVTLLMGCPRLRCRLAARPPRIKARPAGCGPTTHLCHAGGRMRRDHFQPRITSSHGSPAPTDRVGWWEGSPRIPHTYPLVAPQRSLRRADSPPPRLCGGRRGIRGSRMTFRVAAEQPGREWILAAGMQRHPSRVRASKSSRF